MKEGNLQAPLQRVFAYLVDEIEKWMSYNDLVGMADVLLPF